MQTYLILATDFIMAMLIAAGLIKMLLYVSYKNRIFDLPDASRRVHTVPVPRLGGMSFMPTLLVVIAFTVGFLYRFNVLASPIQDNVLLIRVAYMLGSGLMLYVLGIVDDLTDLGYKVKFLVQFAAAALLVSGGLWINNLYGLFGVWRIPFYVGMPLTVLIMVLITNAINLIDGIDGLASGLSIITLGVLSVIFVYERKFVYSMTSLTMLGAVASFWLFNVFGGVTASGNIVLRADPMPTETVEVFGYGTFDNGATWTFADGDGRFAFRDRPLEGMFLLDKRSGFSIFVR